MSDELIDEFLTANEVEIVLGLIECEQSPIIKKCMQRLIDNTQLLVLALSELRDMKIAADSSRERIAELEEKVCRLRKMYDDLITQTNNRSTLYDTFGD